MKGGKVLIVGGQSFGVASSSLEVFDPVSQTFTAVTGTMSSPRYQHAAAVLSDGRVLVAGGSNGTAALDSIDIYDPDTQAARPAGRLTAPRQGLSATTLVDGQVLIAGGSNGSTELATVEIFNAMKGTVQPAGSMNSARQGHLAFRLPNNNAILLAGGTAAGAPLASAEVYVPWTGAIQPIESLSTPRAQALGGATGRTGLLLVSGGRTATGVSLTAEALSYATITTDQLDYSPGSTVTVTGAGWQPGETVQLLIHEVPTVEPDLTLTAVADANGNIINTQFEPDLLDIGTTFYLTATGLQSGLQAQTTFTDGCCMTPPRYSTSLAGPFGKGTLASPFIGLYGQPLFITTAPPTAGTCPTVTFDYASAGTPGALTTLLPGTTPNTTYPTSFNSPNTPPNLLTIGAWEVAVATPTSCSGVNASDNSYLTINGTISGVIYIDVNCNGVFDPGTDQPLPGVTVTLGSDSAVSAANGSFTLSNGGKGYAPGSYTLSAPGTFGVDTLEVSPSAAKIVVGGTNITGENFGYTAPTSMNLTKSASPTTYTAASQTITYTYVIKNTGLLPLTGPFKVSDNKVATVICPAVASLAPNATLTCTGTYNTTQADVVNGSITNQATASTTIACGTVTSNQATATVTETQGTGCPATQGFWHKASHWPTVSGTADGVTWDKSAKTLTIGGTTYTQAQILELLPSGSLHSGGVENDLSQFIAAALNIIAGAKHTSAIDAIIGTIASDLSGIDLFSPAPLNIPTQAAADLTLYGTALDNYNSAQGLGCSEGTGLKTGD
jgi:hypothetical protein